MATDLQTVIVSKEIAKTRVQAKRLAKKHTKRFYTSRETAVSWRFRQRPPEDFDRTTFRTVHAEPGIALIYGNLLDGKKNVNPGKPVTDATAFRRSQKFVKKAEGEIKAADQFGLIDVAQQTESVEFYRPIQKELLIALIAKRARKLPALRRRLGTVTTDDGIYNKILTLDRGRQQALALESNPAKAPKKKKASKKKRLKNPKVMPDPGPCANLGTAIEFKWKCTNPKSKNKEVIWDAENDRKKWLFLWSPKYKAVIAARDPSMKKKLGKMLRDGGAAKLFERFMAREPTKMHEASIPDIPLKKLGKAEHIVYRSDKWNNGKVMTDYIHQFKGGVELYCGPNLKKPEVFLCFGGKLTCTERGLVY